MSIRIAIAFYFIFAAAFILGGLSLQLAPVLDHFPVPRDLQMMLFLIGTVFLIDALFLVRRNPVAIQIARILAVLCLAGLLFLLVHMPAINLFAAIVASLFAAFFWMSFVFAKITKKAPSI